MKCPLHESPLNSEGLCMLCELETGAYDHQIEPGSPLEAEHRYYKTYASAISQQNVEKALKEIEAHEDGT